MIYWMTCLTIMCFCFTVLWIILLKLVINIRRAIIYNNDALRDAMDQLYSNFLANPQLSHYPPRQINPADFDDDMKRLGIDIERKLE